MPSFDKLYSRDSHGNVREWHMQVNGSSYRSVSGILDGNMVTSEWRVASGMNEGKKNATTDEEQAVAEVESAYALKLRMKYHRDINDIDKDIFFKPMLAESYTKRYTDKGESLTFPVAAQPKLDGMRCIMTAEGAWSRTGKPIHTIEHILMALEPLFIKDPELVLDGELYNHDLKDDFNEIMSLVKRQPPSDPTNVKKMAAWADDLLKSEENVQYHIYDCPSHPGGFFERSCRVAELVGPFADVYQSIVLVDTPIAHNQDDLDAQYGAWLEQGYEGQMIRLFEGDYQNKRSKTLLKRKEFIDEEFEVIAVLEGQGNWAGYAKSITCVNSSGQVFNAGVKGNQEYTKNLLETAYVDGKLTYKEVTVRYQNLTPDGIPRFPIAVALHSTERW